MREYLRDKRKFTDWEKATLIWNSLVSTWRERLDMLLELSEMTTDAILKCQIKERVKYEDKAYRLFTENQNNKFVYVVYDKERSANGFFAEYEMARQYGIKECVENEENHFCIEKQLLFGNKTKNDVIEPWVSKRNILKGSIISESGYDGRENAFARYHKNGEMNYFYSMEMSAEENERVDTMNRQRFEYRFFKIPFGLPAGTVVKRLDCESYAVLAQGEEQWIDYMNQTDRNPSYYDFSDIQSVVFDIEKDGHWSHDHANPIYLEPEIPKAEEKNEENEAYKKALCALSNYFKSETKEASDKALEASRNYADKSAGYFNWGKIVYGADHIEKLLF